MPVRAAIRLLVLGAACLAWSLPGGCAGGGDEAGEPEAAPPPPTTEQIAELQREITLEGQAGRWTKLRPGPDAEEPTPEQQREIRRLQSLGYVAGSRPAPARQGVVLHDRDRARPGSNLYTSGHAPEAVLMDMDGRVLHRWRRAYREIWPETDTPPGELATQYWRRARLLPGGELLAIVEGHGLVKLDRRSRVIWARHQGAHHDLEVLPGGDILVLERTAHVLPRIHPRDPVLEDFIVRLGPDGQEKQRVSILAAFENATAGGEVWQQARKRKGDIFHTNSLELLDGRAAARHPAFTAGRVLVSIRELDALAVVDLDSAAVVWALQGDFDAQHDATVLDDGTIMLFDNEDAPAVSAVEILDPATGERLWQYRGTPERPFYSRTCGTSQPLVGGHLLVTESDNGRAFEITRGGEVVWDFFNPHRAGEAGEYVATLFEVLRLPADLDLSWADGAGDPGMH